MRISVVAARVAALGVLTALLCAPGVAARADQTGTGTDPSGYTVSVSIHFTGSAAPGGDAYLPVDVHPTCYWAPADGPYTDAVAMLAWYDGVTGGLQTRDIVDQYGPRSEWKAAADAEAAGTADTSWYIATCESPDEYNKFGVGSVEGVDPIPGDPVNYVTFRYHPFNAGEAIPPPLVSSRELALAARRVMHIQTPVLGRNPKLKGSAATLVGLPTWFWATNAQSVGYDQGTLDITASLRGVSATVTAVTDGLHLGLDPGYGHSASCPPEQSLIQYGSGDKNATDATACTVTFLHSGAPHVTASTAWTATWVGSDGDGGGLDGLDEAADAIVVPVVEVQNIVVR